jgi:hypothetical protein
MFSVCIDLTPCRESGIGSEPMQKETRGISSGLLRVDITSPTG